MPWHVYLLKCADNTLYCGVTTDLERRISQHNDGSGAKYTRARRPVTLACSITCADRSQAQRMEYSVRQKPAREKIAYLESMQGKTI